MVHKKDSEKKIEKNTEKNSNMKKFLGVAIGSFCLGGAVFYLLGGSFLHIGNIISGVNFPLTNPALNYNELQDLIMSNKVLDLSKQIQSYFQEKKAEGMITHLSVYYRNLNNGGWFGLNEKEEFSPASLMKLPILLTYIKKSESQKGFLEQKIVYKKSPNVDEYKQNIPPEKQLKDGELYSLWDILEYMMMYSDNHASVFLESLVPLDAFKKTYADLGIEFPTMVNGSFDNNTKVVDYARFFRILFNSSYLTREDSEKVLTLLTKVEFKAGLVAGLPSNIAVAHKFGERGIVGVNGIEEKQLHDCGIVYYPNHPYILCIMSRGSSQEKLEETIADMSKLVYEKIEEQYGNNVLDVN